MSDPVSSKDVEDVLSSIRRLVSEEAKGNGAQDGELIAPDIHEAAENAAETALAEIVQQVTGEPPSNDDSDPDATAGGADAGDGADAPAMSFRHQAASAARRAASDAADKLVLTADFRVSDPAESRNNDPGQPADGPETAQADPPGVLHLHPVSETGAQDSGADDDDAATPRQERPDPFAFASEDTLFDRARRAMEGPGAATSAPPAQPDPEPVETPAAANAPDDTEMTPPHDTAGAEATETATAGSPPQQDGPATGAEGDKGEDEPLERINFVEEEESILDEETLRDLVAEMVRQELQGELGDRITRNVRKLVRREIQRALASREFE